MVAAAWGGAKDADLVVLLVDAKGGANPETCAIAERLREAGRRCWLVLNKNRSGAGDSPVAADRHAIRVGAVRGNLHGQRDDRRRAEYTE